jgi:hypothetical protein
METKEGVLRKFIRQHGHKRRYIKNNSYVSWLLMQCLGDVSLLNNSKFGNFVDPEKEQNGTQRSTQHTHTTCLNPDIA